MADVTAQAERSSGSAEIRRQLERLSPIVRQLRARYEKLERREKLLVQIGAAVAAVFLLYNLIILPVLGLRESLDTQVQNRERQVVAIQKMADKYQRLAIQLATLQKKTAPPGKDFSLFSVLEKTLSQSVGRDRIGSITPADRKISNEFTAYTVELKLNGVTLDQLVDTLYAVKVLSVPVMVSNLNVKKRFQDPRTYDVDMTCFTLGKNG